MLFKQPVKMVNDISIKYILLNNELQNLKTYEKTTYYFSDCIECCVCSQ